jgi:predicted Zn-dependent peptidase
MVGMGHTQNLASFESRISVRVLPNGLTILIMERPGSPVISCYTHVDVGAVQDKPGLSGAAHLFEHMAFKGTDAIGTLNYRSERVALEAVESAYRKYRQALVQPHGVSKERLIALEKAWKGAIARADSYSASSEFANIVTSQGGTRLNAFTTWDETAYTYSFPENRLELWAYLESERFLHPIMREFYKERDVVAEERRQRIDNAPLGMLVEELLRTAFTVHPYGRPATGWPSDISTISAADALQFFEDNYSPSRMLVAVVGDVKAVDALPLLAQYFGRLPPRLPKDEPLLTEPAQRGLRQVIMRGNTQPLYIEGYHRPNFRDPDDAVYDVLALLLSEGRTSRLYRSLVTTSQLAVSVQAGTMPGNKYPSLFFVLAVPSRGHTTTQISAAVHSELEKLANESMSTDELAAVKSRAAALVLRGLTSNSDLAMQLGNTQSLYGDWREIFYQIQRIRAVQAEDVKRVASSVFSERNRTVALIEADRPTTVQNATSAGEK